MKTLQTVAVKLLCLGLLLFAVALFAYDSSALYKMATERIPDWDWLRRTVAVLGGLVALWALIPLPRRRSVTKSISFPDAQGTTTIRLGSIEKALERELVKQREVKRIVVRIEPADDNRRVWLVADVALVKPPGTATRDVAASLKAFIAQQAREILGPDEVVGVDLTIERILVDRKARGALEEAPPLLDETPEEPERPFDEAKPGVSYLPGRGQAEEEGEPGPDELPSAPQSTGFADLSAAEGQQTPLVFERDREEDRP